MNMDESMESIFSEAGVSGLVTPKKRKMPVMNIQMEPELESERELASEVRETILFDGLKTLLEKVQPSVFQKDSKHGSYLIKLIFDVIRISQMIDSSDDLGCVEFLDIQERIMNTLNTILDLGRDRFSNDSASIERTSEVPTSLYEDQFKEISLIGSGGFGKVYKAEHKLDEMKYAVKKIKIKARKTHKIQRSLQEVRTLAKLHHPNIVVYKQAWIETLAPVDDFESQSSSEASSDLISISSSEINEFKNCNINSNNRGKCSEDDDDNSTIVQVPEKILMLYIQMSLCEKNLREWMDQRTGMPSLPDIETIATQILRGLNYIHNMNVIHHDINPKNIFISIKSGHIQVQLGDFGMACIMKRVAHSQDFGTPLYAAPEQINKECDEKSDIYSFGIVLFELLYPMHSTMELSEKLKTVKLEAPPNERIKSIEELIKGMRIPKTQTKIWVHTIERTTRYNSKNRPSAELLLDAIERSNVKKVKHLQSENEHLKEEIRRMRMQQGNGLYWRSSLTEINNSIIE